MALRQWMRDYGGIRFPDQTEPPPGPLARLAAEMKQQASQGHSASPAVKRMLADLPEHLYPRVLARNHPDVVEQIADAWKNARAARMLLDDLMFARPRSAPGFNFAEVAELTELAEHVQRVRLRDRPSVWDEAMGLV